MQKVVRDGKVAVLFSPTFGAGWWTFNTEIPECLFDPEIVELVERGASFEEIKRAAPQRWPGGYWGGADGLRVQWVKEGESITLEEYDGSESFRFRDSDGWVIA